MADVMTIPMPAANIPAKSMADGFAEGKPDAAYSQSPAPDFAAELKAAQVKDKGIAPAESPKPADPAPPPPPPVKPSVPGAPVAPVVEEWKPTGKAAEHWQRLKDTHQAESATLKAQIEAMKSEISAAKAAGLDPAEIKTLRDQLKEHQQILRDVAIERDPEFQKRFSTKEKSAIDSAKLAAGEKGSKLEELLKLPMSPWRDEQINEIVEELPASSQRRVNAALALMEQVDVERSAEIAIRRAEFDQRQAAGLDNQKAQQAAKLQEFNQAFDTELKAFSDPAAGHPFLREKAGDDTHNKEVAASKELASTLHKAFLGGQLTASDIAKAMLHVSISERMMKSAQAATERAEKAEKALDRLRGVQPGDGRNGSPSGGHDEASPAPGTEAYRSHLAKQLKEAQARDKLASQARML